MAEGKLRLNGAADGDRCLENCRFVTGSSCRRERGGEGEGSDGGGAGG